MKKRIKIQCALFCVIAFIVLPMCLLFYQAPNAKAFNNNQLKCSNEVWQGWYAFTPDPDPDYNTGSYGVHDWIADAAIRLILKDDNYRHLFQWLFDYDHPQHTTSNKADFNQFTGYGWVSTSDSAYYKYYADGMNCGMGEQTWLAARRYVNFLHGTGGPDNMGDVRGIVVEDDYVLTEAGTWIAKWKNTQGGSRQHGHHVSFYVSPKGNSVYPNEFNSVAMNILLARKQALEFLETEYTYKNINTGETVERKGKYEAAAQCLGGIAHYIGDLANPRKTEPTPLNSYGWAQTRVEKEAIYVESENHDGVEHFINGGPNYYWDGGDNDLKNLDPTFIYYPYEEYVRDEELRQLTLVPMHPIVAMFLMADTTFGAIDYYPEGSDFESRSLYDRYYASINFAKDSYGSENYKFRVITLLKYAAYYTACALIDIVKDADIDPDNFNGRLLDINIWQPEGVSVPNPAPHTVPERKLLEKIQSKHDNYMAKRSEDLNKKNRNMYMLSAAILVPMLAVVVIPTIAYSIIVKKWITV